MFSPRSFLFHREPELHELPMIFRPIEAQDPHPHLRINPVHISAAVSVACVMGMGLGLWLRTDIDRRAAATALRQTAPRAVAAAPVQQQVQIVLARPADDVIAPPTSLMDVGVPTPAPAPAAQTGDIVEAAYAEAPSFDCHATRTLADQMVCVDPALAEADRRLDRAYRSAMSSGVAYPALARDQARWLAAREAAAKASPEALASLYETRIAELSPDENPARPGPSGVRQTHLAGAAAQPVS